MIRDEGLVPERIKVFAAPAGGPKWFVSVGFDRAIIKSRLFHRGQGRVPSRRVFSGRMEVPYHGLSKSR